MRVTFLLIVCLLPLIYGEKFHLPALDKLDEHIGNLWSKFKTGYGFVYNTPVEELQRFNIFNENVKMILQHNIEEDLGLHTYRLGINQFAALSNEEFRKTMNGYRRQKNDRNQDVRSQQIPISPYVAIPVSVDWRDQGIVTPVKDQGQCGSCWAFSTGQHARSTGKLVSLSEQQLVDCSTNWGNEGCNGGLMDNAFKYVHDNKGIDDNVTYPYLAQDGTCKFKRKAVASTCDSFVDIPSGVYSDPECSSEDLDHGVLAVGYGTLKDATKAKQDYYIVKNSWSENWGDKGYLKMARNKKNMCGIATAASYPVVTDKTTIKDLLT
ncbi:unnamed protein product [Didymodactylos carnosus]|uniref:Cathepsin L n=1 Tax=Didymodactylos carnosus TaxID=1234261 RepID=A0A8S2MWJ6_9BILA|nr:unnamed protein product [Didymodactylos carnosus]CAF3973289.1 unnamed protein product [Didymodactylos carnosus]